MKASQTTRKRRNRVTKGFCARGGRIAISCPALLLAWSATADTVDLNNNQKLDGTVRFGDGVVIVTGDPSGQRELSLDQIRKLELIPTEEALAAAGWLAPGWSRADLGSVAKPGTAGQGRNALVVQSGSFKPRVDRPEEGNDGCGHLVYRKISIPGHIEARVDAVDGPDANRPAGGGGLMVRASSDPKSPWVRLVVGQDGSITAKGTHGGGGEIGAFGSVQAKFPCSLRLELGDSEIEASFSRDGEEWIRVGTWRFEKSAWMPSAPPNLAPEARKPESGAVPPAPGMIEGGFVALGSSPVRSTSVRFTTARFSGRGLLGHYYFDDNFEELAFNRVDPFLKFEWGTGSPRADLAPDKFSVRWEGYFTPKETAEHIFYLHADDSAAVQIDDEIVNGKFWNEYKKHKPTPKLVQAGKRHRIRVSMFERRERGREARLWLHTFSRLDWEKHNRRKGGGGTWWDDHIARGDVLSCEFDALAERPEPATGSRKEPGIELIDGSFLAGRIASADRAAIQVVRNDGARVTVSIPHVASIQLQPREVAEEPGAKLRRSGLLFGGGDFLDAEFEGIRDGKLIVSSVLFGAQKFAINDPKLSEFILRQTRDRKALRPFAVRTIDGSRYLASSVTILKNLVRLEVPLIRNGAIEIPSSQVKVLIRETRESAPSPK